MIKRDDILSMEYLKKTEYTGCHQGMRYRLEQAAGENSQLLRVTVWPEPFNYFKTPQDQKTSAAFEFSEAGVEEAVAWMNERLEADKEEWDHAGDNWTGYRLE